MFMHCVDVGNNCQPGWWGNWHVDGAHLNQSDNFAFLDGHAGLYPVSGFVKHWLSRKPSSTAYVYTYPAKAMSRPGMAEWWVPPWYPDGPRYNYGGLVPQHY